MQVVGFSNLKIFELHHKIFFEFWHITKLIEPPYRHIRSHVVVMKQKISTNLFDEEDPFSCLRLDRVRPSCCGIWNNFCRGHFESAPCWGRSYKDCMFCRLVIPNGGRAIHGHSVRGRYRCDSGQFFANSKSYSHKWWRAELAKLTVVLCYCVYPQNYAFVWVKTQDKAIDGQAAVKDSAFKIILWPPLGSYMSFFSLSLSSSWWTWMTVVALFQKA